MEYKCERCHYNAKYKTHYVEHLSRKHPCNSMFSEKSPSVLLEELQQKYDNKPHECPICRLRFSHASGLSRHKTQMHSSDESKPSYIINSTRDSHDSNSIDNHYQNSHNQVTQSHNQISTTTTTTNSHNTTNNINITININPLGEENIKQVEEQLDLLTNCLKNILGDGIPNIIEKIHLNPEIPENKNVTLQRIKKPSTMNVYERDDNGEPKWVEKDMNATLDNLISKGLNLLKKHHHSTTPPINDAMTMEQREILDQRNERISKIDRKSRGNYRSVRDNVLNKFKDDRNKEAK